MKYIISSEICKKCARCCKITPFVELTINEIISLEAFTGLHFNVFTNQKGPIIDEFFLQLQDNGYCFFLNENNGSYSCGVYEARPDICKNYPSESRQKEACDANMTKLLSTALPQPFPVAGSAASDDKKP